MVSSVKFFFDDFAFSLSEIFIFSPPRPNAIEYVFTVIIMLGTWFFAIKKHGFGLTGTVLAMAALSILFPDIAISPTGMLIIGTFGIGLLWLYDFHPRDIAQATDSSQWQEKYIATLAIVAVVCTVAIVIIPHILDLSIPSKDAITKLYEEFCTHPVKLFEKAPGHCICACIFNLNGLVWLIIHGPRRLFEIATGKSHHHH